MPPTNKLFAANRPSKMFGVLTRLARLSLIAAIASALGFAGHWHWLLDLCAHFRWQYQLAMLLGLVAAVVTRKRGTAAVLIVAALVNAWSLATANGPAQDAHTSVAGAQRLKLLLANIHLDNKNLAPLLALIERESPDVVGILELSPQAAETLAVLEPRYPNSAINPRDDPFGIGLYSRLPARILQSTMPPLDLPVMQLQWTDPQPGKLWLVHPFPPIGSEATQWRNIQLEHIATLIRGDESAVLAGDLNTTPWSAAYRQLRNDAALLDSSATQWAWPTWFGPHWWTGVMAVPIDHVLHASGWRVIRHQIGPDIGSDHRPIIVTLERVGSRD